VTDEQQNGVRQAVNFKRAFIQMEDRCARIACCIDPQLLSSRLLKSSVFEALSMNGKSAMMSENPHSSEHRRRTRRVFSSLMVNIHN
jgi:hypothetical protein